jgi:hypothetical protein
MNRHIHAALILRLDVLECVEIKVIQVSFLILLNTSKKAYMNNLVELSSQVL